MYAPILPSRAFDYTTPAPSPPPPADRLVIDTVSRSRSPQIDIVIDNEPATTNHLNNDQQVCLVPEENEDQPAVPNGEKQIKLPEVGNESIG